MQPDVVAEFREEEEWIVPLTAGFEIYEKRFASICDQDIVGAKITVCESKGMELVNDIKDAKKELFFDGLMAPQGWPLNHLHCKAVAVEIDEFRSVLKI